MKLLNYVLIMIFSLGIFAGGMVLFWFLSKGDFSPAVNSTYVNLEFNANNTSKTSEIIQNIEESRLAYEQALKLSCKIIDLSISSQPSEVKVIARLECV